MVSPKAIAFSSVVLLGTCVLASGWLSLRSKYISASTAEVRALVRPELLVVEPRDAAAEARYARFVAILKQMTWPPARPSATLTSPAERKATVAEWNVNARALSELEAILREGPLARHWSPAMGPVHRADGSRAFFSRLVRTSEAFAAGGNFTEATDLCLLGFRILGRFEERPALLAHYLLDYGVEQQLLVHVIQISKKSRVDAVTLRRLLTATPHAQVIDPGLQMAARKEFQVMVLPWLNDPRSYFQKNDHMFVERVDGEANAALPPGTYDALATARRADELYGSFLKNAVLPATKQDRAPSLRLETEVATFPYFNGYGQGSDNSFQGVWTRFMMNRHRNSLGALLLYGYGTIHYMGSSFNRRSIREIVRTALALRLFERENGKRAAGLQPLVDAGYLKRLPHDFNSGMTLRYDPTSRKLWSIGSDMKDDGGTFRASLQSNPDLGVQL